MPETPGSISATDAYRRLLQYAIPYWKGFAVAVVGMIIVAASSTGFAALMKPMLNGSFVDKDPEMIRLIPIAIVGIFIVRGLAGFLANYGMDWIGRWVIHDLRRDIFTHYLSLPARYFDHHPVGRLTSRLIFDVEQVATATTKVILVVVRDSFTVIGLLGWMLYLNWQLSSFFLIVVPAITLVIVGLGKRFRRISRRIQASMGNVTQISQQTIEGSKVVKIYGGVEYEKRQFYNANRFNRSQYMKMAVTNAVSVQVSQLFGGIAVAAMLFYATSDTMIKEVDVGTFMSFTMASMMLLAPLKALTQVVSSLNQGIAAAQSIFGVLDEKQEQDTGERTLEKARGELNFSHVRFSYDDVNGDASTDVLKDINIRVNPGETVALVGRSGSGKSTLVSLVPRFYELGSGEISLDGLPITSLTISNLREHIGYVTQEVTLFDDTIRHNIAYGSRKDASDEEIQKACDAAHASEFIDELPNGLETLVGDKGVLLSGGQRQRLAIARALLKDAPVLILDEATSSLDTESERYIQDALERLMVNRTTLVIAHRLSTIENADKIIVLDKGKVVEEGTHDELLAKAGHYAALHKIQFEEPA